MEEGSQPPILPLIALFVFSAYLSLAETAFASVSKNRLKTAADRGDSRAKTALWVVDRLDRAITTILIWHNAAAITMATIATVYVTKRWGVNFVTLSTILITLATFFLGEMVPKTIGKRYSYKASLSSAALMKTLMQLIKPLASALSFIGRKASEHTHGDDDGAVTEDEIQDIVEDMAEEGSIDEDQKELITSAMQFGDVRARDILTPRMNVTALDIDTPLEEILSFVKDQTHSRIPVYKGSIDNIIGILGIRRFLKGYIKYGKKLRLKPLINRVYFVHADTEIHEILPLMSKKKINMAVVKDEYGGNAGIITVEDIIEELVGDIWDESDIVEESSVHSRDASGAGRGKTKSERKDEPDEIREVYLDDELTAQRASRTRTEEKTADSLQEKEEAEK